MSLKYETRYNKTCAAVLTSKRQVGEKNLEVSKKYS